MSGNYEHDQERIINTAAHTLQTAASVATQLWTMRSKPLKVEIRTAAQDAQDAHKAIEQGVPKQEILKSIRTGDTHQRIAKAGGDTHKYEQLIMRRAEIDHAVKMMPSPSLAPAKTPKKKLWKSSKPDHQYSNAIAITQAFLDTSSVLNI